MLKNSSEQRVENYVDVWKCERSYHWPSDEWMSAGGLFCGQLLDLTLKNRLVAVAKHLWLNKFAHNVLNLLIWFSLICGGALIPGLIGSSAFVEMIRMVQTGGSFAGVYRGTGTDVFGECVLWLIVGIDAKESFSRSFKASVVEEICPQCFESFKRCKKNNHNKNRHKPLNTILW